MNEDHSRLNRTRHRSSRSRRTSRKRPLWKKILLVFLLVCVVGLIAGGGLFAYYASKAPELKADALTTPAASEILDRNGDVLATVGTKQRDLVTYDNIPSLIEDAVLATEDARFYNHFGVDPIRLGGALIANLTEGFGSEGGSTITQQVVKRSLLTSEKTLERKAQEAWLAIQLENEYSKEEILEMYLNKIYYSDNIYGIQTASRYYFGKDLAELTLPQAALLAGMPQSPNHYNPYDFPERAKERRDVVLELMEQHGKITEQEMQEAQQVPITEGLVDRSEGERSTLAERKGDEAFVDVVLSEIEKYGEYDIFEDGLKIHTTMDADAQEFMETMLNTDEVISYPEDKNGDAFQAGITLLDTQTGAVRAIGGGRDYGESEQRGFNFATDTSRQPGSAIKPLLVYAPAIEKMQWSTAHVLIDEPIEYANGYQPRNWDDQFKGPVSIREALWDSRNIPAIKAFNQTGHEYAASFIEQLGFAIDEPLDESAAIGGGNANTNSFEMAGAFAALGNKGNFTEPYTITRIESRDGTVMETKPENSKAMEPHTAFMVTDMLKSVIEHPEGTGTEAGIPDLPVAGKTGTTNYSEEEREKFGLTSDHAPDSWFVGYTTEYTAAVWTGYEHKENPLTSEERDTAQQIFKALMQHVSRQGDTADFEKPADVVTVDIEEGTNPPKRASAFTPEEKITEELFIEGTEPEETSQSYVPDLQAPTDLSADYNREDQTISLNWSHSQEERDNRQVSFEVTKSENGESPETVTTTEQRNILLEEIQPDSVYTFTVTAVSENERSEPSVIRIDTEMHQPESPDSSEPEEEESSPPENAENEGDDSAEEQENEEESNTGQETEPPAEEQEEGSPPEDTENEGDDSAEDQENEEESNTSQETDPPAEEQEDNPEQEESDQNNDPSENEGDNSAEEQENEEESDTSQETDPPAEEQENNPEQEESDQNNDPSENEGNEEENTDQENGSPDEQEGTEGNDSGQEADPIEEQQENESEEQESSNPENEENADGNEEGEQETEEQQETEPPPEEQGNGNEEDNSSEGQMGANENNPNEEGDSSAEEANSEEETEGNENPSDEEPNETNNENESDSSPVNQEEPESSSENTDSGSENN